MGPFGGTAKGGARHAGRIAAAAAVLAALAIGLPTYAAYRRDIRAARARVASGSLIAETRSGPIEYAIVGEGSPVLMVHGAGGGYDQGLDIGAPLARNGMRIIAMSRFGYLRTPLPPEAAAAAQADAHAHLLDALGIARAAIIGASAGALSAMQFALRHRERCSALVLLVPVAYVPRPGGAPSISAPPGIRHALEWALRSDFLFWAVPRVRRGAVIRAFLGTPPEVVARASAAEQARVATMLDHILPIAPRRAGLMNDAKLVTSIERYELERIAVPTLALSAADDLYGTFDAAKYTAEHIAGARFIGYPGGGHLCVGYEDDVVTRIAAFLSQ
ncbi:MAG TPA: alpha/beta hydrolase [Casimicrobiaceae bacterium]|nr:alpha/beta hydrolase [Casimicrobiaceae bacterium]